MWGLTAVIRPRRLDSFSDGIFRRSGSSATCSDRQSVIHASCLPWRVTMTSLSQTFTLECCCQWSLHDFGAKVLRCWSAPGFGGVGLRRLTMKTLTPSLCSFSTASFAETLMLRSACFFCASCCCRKIITISTMHSSIFLTIQANGIARLLLSFSRASRNFWIVSDLAARRILSKSATCLLYDLCPLWWCSDSGPHCWQWSPTVRPSTARCSTPVQCFWSPHAAILLAAPLASLLSSRPASPSARTSSASSVASLAHWPQVYSLWRALPVVFLSIVA